MRFFLFLLCNFFITLASAEKFIAINKHMLLTDKGNVYSIDTGYDVKGAWGELGKSFYLGRASTDFIGKVDYLSNIKKIFVENGAFVALTNDGKVYVWGLNEAKATWAKGEFCGGALGKNVTKIIAPEILEFDGELVNDVVHLPCVGFSSITEEGNVFIWGLGGRYYSSSDKSSRRYFDFVDEEPFGIRVLPKKIDVPGRVVSSSLDVFVLDDERTFFLGRGPFAKTLKLYKGCDDFLCEFIDIKAKWVSPYSEVKLSNNDIYYPSFYPVSAGVIDDECVQFIHDQSYVSCSGDIFRAGHLAVYKGWFAAQVDDSESSFVEVDRNKHVALFNRDAFITDNGEIYVYGHDSLGFGRLPLYRDALNLIFPSLDFNSRSIQKKFYKILDSTVLNGD